MNNISKQSLSKNSINDDVIISVLQTLPVGVIIYNLKNILFANDSAFNHLNFDKKLKKGIVALSIFDFLLPEYHKLAKANIRQLLKGKTPNNLLFKLKNQKQEVFNIEVKSSIITFNGKKQYKQLLLKLMIE